MSLFFATIAFVFEFHQYYPRIGVFVQQTLISFPEQAKMLKGCTGQPLIGNVNCQQSPFSETMILSAIPAPIARRDPLTVIMKGPGAPFCIISISDPGTSPMLNNRSCIPRPPAKDDIFILFPDDAIGRGITFVSIFNHNAPLLR